MASTRVIELPSEKIPLVNLDQETPFRHSPLGVWRIVCEDLATAVRDSLELVDDIRNETENAIISGTVATRGGRRNINLYGPSVVDAAEGRAQKPAQVVQRLRSQTRLASKRISRALEVWLQAEEGSIQAAHKQGSRTAIRLLEVPAGVEVPPHPDASGYTLVFTTGTIDIQDPQDEDIWWRLCQHPPNGCYMFLGSHLENQLSDRLLLLEQTKDRSKAPIHRAITSPTHRAASTIHIKADRSWPSLNDGSHPVETADKLLSKHLGWDSEQFASLQVEKNQVPTKQKIRDHWALLQAIVEGVSLTESPCKHHNYRLPDVAHQRYWKLQLIRYYGFLMLHRRFPEESKGILPPRVIHHIWISHQLQPASYKADCTFLFSFGILPHDNKHFCLDGCPRFHKLWERAFGTKWPEPYILRDEVLKSSMIPVSTNMPDSCLKANILSGLDSLVNLYDGVCADVPNFLASLLKKKSTAGSECVEEARKQYAQFLLASSYASSKGIGITPGAINDLLWHTHQTGPVEYSKSMEQMPTFVDHNPCGKLSPPPDDCNWLEMTKRVWMDLYGAGVDVPGHGLYCCSPEECESKAKPTSGLYVQCPENGRSRYSWWLQEKHLTPLHSESWILCGLDMSDQQCEQISGLCSPTGGSTMDGFQVELKQFRKEWFALNAAAQASVCTIPSFLITFFPFVWSFQYLFSERREVFAERREVQNNQQKMKYEDLVDSYNTRFERQYGLSISLLWEHRFTDPLKEFEQNKHHLGPAVLIRQVQVPDQSWSGRVWSELKA